MKVKSEKVSWAKVYKKILGHSKVELVEDKMSYE